MRYFFNFYHQIVHRLTIKSYEKYYSFLLAFIICDNLSADKRLALTVNIQQQVYLWISRGKQLRLQHEVHWNLLKCTEVRWNLLKSHEISWSPCKSFEVCEVSWSLMKSFEVFWSLMKSFEVLWSLIKSLGVLWSL